jgi:hypothetical protein
MPSECDASLGPLSTHQALQEPGPRFPGVKGSNPARYVRNQRQGRKGGMGT